MTSLTNKTLVLTGASQGIGRACALGLAQRGVNLVLSARSEDLLRKTSSECETLGVQTIAVPGDASQTDVAEVLVGEALGLGGFRGFVHAAGVLRPGPTVWELGGDDFDEVVSANLRAAWQLARFAYPPLLEADKGGVAVFFGSGAAEKTQPGIGVYCAAKAAEEHLMRQLAAETDRVTAFVYRPGVVETRMQVQAREAEGGAAREIRTVFRSWKEQGLLLTPAQSAAGLISLLFGGHGPLHGSVFDVREL